MEGRSRLVSFLLIMFWMVAGVVLWECGITNLIATLGKWLQYAISTLSGVDPTVVDDGARSFWQKVIPGGR